jgi:hypothetical protein
MEFETGEAVNEDWDNTMGHYTESDDYTKLGTPRKHKIRNNDNVNGNKPRTTLMTGTGVGNVSMTFVLQDIRKLPSAQKQDILDIELMQLTIDKQTNIHSKKYRKLMVL